MEIEYWTECPSCEVETQVLVLDETEIPTYCPMCGYSTDFDELEDD